MFSYPKKLAYKQKQAKYVERNVEACSCNHYCSRKAIGITYSECVFESLVIYHAMRMRHIVICGLFFFFTESHKRHDFRKTKL